MTTLLDLFGLGWFHLAVVMVMGIAAALGALEVSSRCWHRLAHRRHAGLRVTHDDGGA
jgi:hypothetical protein